MTTATTLGKTRTNIMGTLSFDMKIQGMRKPQEFIVYPMQKGDDNQTILIQSSTRIGRLNLKTGSGLMSQSHQSGAYGPHLSMDKLTPFTLTPLDLQTLKMQLFCTAGEKVGDRGIHSDNSQAINIFDL